MTFEDAVRKSIKAYFEGKDPENLLEAMGGTKYTREYFDEMEEELLGEKPEPEMEEDEVLENGDI
jgi:hypothetical protein